MKINCLYTLDNGREVLCDEFYITPEGHNIWSWFSTMEGRMYYCEETNTYHSSLDIDDYITGDGEYDEDYSIDDVLNVIDEDICNYLECKELGLI